MSDTAQKLANARQRAEKARANAAAAYGRVGVPDDPGAVSGIRRTNTARQARQATATTNRALSLTYEAVCAEREVHRLEAKLATEQREAALDDGATVDLDRLRPGDHIRHRKHGVSRWESVYRVNAKTITCQEHFAGHDKPKVPKERVLETRHQEAA